MAEISGDGGGVGTLPPDAQGLPPPRPDDDYALRCMICNVDWPPIPGLWDAPSDDDDLMTREEVHEWLEKAVENELTCPVCEEQVIFARNLQPIPDEEAWSLKNHADFERFYESSRGRPLDD